jgi:hypothetical protein
MGGRPQRRASRSSAASLSRPMDRGHSTHSALRREWAALWTRGGPSKGQSGARRGVRSRYAPGKAPSDDRTTECTAARHLPANARNRIPLRNRYSSGWIRTTDLTIMSRAPPCKGRVRAGTAGGKTPARRTFRGSSQSPGGTVRAHTGGPVVDPRRGGPMHSLPARAGPGTCAVTSAGSPGGAVRDPAPSAICGSKGGPPDVPAVRPRRKPPPMWFALSHPRMQ